MGNGHVEKGALQSVRQRHTLHSGVSVCVVVAFAVRRVAYRVSRVAVRVPCAVCRVWVCRVPCAVCAMCATYVPVCHALCSACGAVRTLPSVP